MPTVPTVTDSDYARLLTIRTRLRSFERWSADRAREHGLTASQHQLLLAVRGHPDPDGLTVGQVAEYLFIRPNTAVELVDRTAEAGLLVRRRDAADHRVVRLALTDDAHRRLAALSAAHIQELAALEPMVAELIRELR